MELASHITRVQDFAQNLKDARIGVLRHPGDFLDYQRISRPKDMQEYMKRASYNVKYYSANYIILIALLGVYSLLTNVLLLFSMIFLVGGFFAIGRFASEPFDIAGKTITPQNLYLGLFIIGIPMFWIAAPLSTLFWLVGSSGCLIGAHAGLLEPGVEAEYAGVDTV